MLQGGHHLPREVENNSVCKVGAGGKTESIMGRRLDQGATYVCMKECGTTHKQCTGYRATFLIGRYPKSPHHPTAANDSSTSASLDSHLFQAI